MWADIKRFYADSWAFALALPLLFIIPALVEFAQHVVEIRIGMYANRAAARAVAADETRLMFGYAKTLAITLPGYWFVRYMAWGRSTKRATAVVQPAITLFLILFAIRALIQWLALFGPPLGPMLGLAGRPAVTASVVVAVITSVLGVYLTAWSVAWPLGTVTIGPVQSIGVMTGSFWRTLAYTVAGFVPLTALHYAFGYGAMGAPPPLVWALMAIDAVVVGFLALALAGSTYVAAEHAARHKGIVLAPANTIA